MNKKEMYDIYENGERWQKRELTKEPDLPKELIYKLAEDNYWAVKERIVERPDLPTDLIIRLSCDERYWVIKIAFEKLKKLKSLTKDDLKKAFLLIFNSKYVNKTYIKETFDYLNDKFPELSKYIISFREVLLRKF